MNKLVHSLGLMVALAATSLLAGCELYFGSHDDGHGSTWNYCGSDGYYQCSGDSCSWVSATCPDPGTQPPGNYECTSSTDCAAGCYCQDGTCEEGGFCATDSDCGDGYHCNTDRSSCEPNETPPPNQCDYDNQCPQGQYCAPDHTCQATCVCANDQDAVNQGFGWCDETRGTCLPGEDPAGTCAGTPGSDCTTFEPTCPAGQVATLFEGCFTGQCRDYATCDLPPVCEHITDDANCVARTDCDHDVVGHDCHHSDGSSCISGSDPDCVCATNTFVGCFTKTPN